MDADVCGKMVWEGEEGEGWNCDADSRSAGCGDAGEDWKVEEGE